MKAKNRSILIFVLFALTLLSANAFAEPYSALKGVESIKTVFDFKISDPRAAAFQLNLIHETFKDPNLAINGKKPDFVVIFFGRSTRFVSKDRDGFTPEDQRQLDKIAATVSNMAKDGIRLEICMIAARGNGVHPDRILSEIKQVPNGWISLIGYQLEGYALVPNF